MVTNSDERVEIALGLGAALTRVPGSGHGMNPSQLIANNFCTLSNTFISPAAAVLFIIDVVSVQQINYS